MVLSEAPLGVSSADALAMVSGAEIDQAGTSAGWLVEPFGSGDRRSNSG